MSYLGSKDIESLENHPFEIRLVTTYFDDDCEYIRKIMSFKKFMRLSAYGQFGILTLPKYENKEGIIHVPILFKRDKTFEIYRYSINSSFKEIKLNDEIRFFIETYIDEYDSSCLSLCTMDNSFRYYIELIGDENINNIINKLILPEKYKYNEYGIYAIRKYNPKYYYIVFREEMKELYNIIEPQFESLEM